METKIIALCKLVLLNESVAAVVDAKQQLIGLTALTDPNRH